MSGATMLLMSGSSSPGGGGGGSGSGFSATVTGGPQNASGTGGSHTFGTLTCATTGGTAPITYSWSEGDDGNATWTASGTASTLSPHVSAVAAGDVSYATSVCTAADATGKTAVSNSVALSWRNTNTPKGGTS